MKKRDDKGAFRAEIDRRIASSAWSGEIAARVFTRAHAEKRQKVMDAVSALFPLAAAAVLVIVLAFQTEVARTTGQDVTGRHPFDSDVHEIVSNDIDGILGGTWNF
jgi:hypothetical protein